MTPLDRMLYLGILHDRHLYEAEAALRSLEERQQLVDVFDAIEEYLAFDDSGRKVH